MSAVNPLLRFCGFCILLIAAASSATAFADQSSKTTAYEFEFTAIEGDPLPLSKFKGKVVLVVNTASRCGFTHQYADLQTVWQRYRDRGFVLLGVPSNDFGGQEPGSEAEIKTFCEVNFDVDFPLTEKVRVKGNDAHPFISGLLPSWERRRNRAGTSINIWSGPTAASSAGSPRRQIRRRVR